MTAIDPLLASGDPDSIAKTLKDIFGEPVIEKAVLLLETARIEFICQRSITEAVVVHGEGVHTLVRYRWEMQAWRRPASTIHSFCDCGQTNCHHVAATVIKEASNKNPRVLEAIQRSVARPGPQMSFTARQWLAELQSDPNANPNPSTGHRARTDRNVLVYVLDQTSPANRWQVEIRRTTYLKAGGFSKIAAVEQSWRAVLPELIRPSPYGRALPAIEYADEADKVLARKLFLAGALPESNILTLDGRDPGIFSTLAETGRFFLHHHRELPVRIAKATRKAMLEWNRSDSHDDAWVLRCAVEGGADLLSTNPPWYVNSQTAEVGAVDPATIDSVIMRLVRSRKPIFEADFNSVADVLATLPGGHRIPSLPKVTTEVVRDVTPMPVVILDHHQNATYPSGNSVSAELQFEYLGRRVEAGGGNKIVERRDLATTVIERNKSFERECLIRIGSSLDTIPSSGGRFVVASERNCDDYIVAALEYQKTFLPGLQAAGWRVEFKPGFDLRAFPSSEWSVDFQEKEAGWYDIGVTAAIDGKPVDVLSMLKRLLTEQRIVDAIRTGATDRLNGMVFWSRVGLKDGWFEIEVEKVLPLARVLLDLGDGAGAPRVSRFDVATLDTLEGSAIAVRGAEELRKLASALREAPKKLPPKLLKRLALPLRPYQKDGVAWLEARRAAGVGAILGDEMALGKTVQTIAHILVEVVRNPASEPTLLIVGNRLLSKWEDEFAKFAPCLKVVRYSGPDRHGRLDDMQGVHAVLTNPHLAVRDRAILEQKSWSTVVIDEAHNTLVNPSSELSKTVVAIETPHKVLLTGTPLQNKPEDMWALMNVIAPGLLRTLPWFRQRFGRKAIGRGEEGAELFGSRMNLIGRVVSPYLLKRTNHEVGNMIPEVNTVVRHVELGEEQRALYETIRASTHKEIQALIAERGLAAGKLTILAKIARLRQVSCHPALLKRAIGASVNSAKLDYLREVVQELMAEEKAVVITSEWVEMLDLIGQMLTTEGFNYSMIVGGQSAIAFQAEVNAFRRGNNKILLMTLGVGGEGHDFPEADVMIHFAPWWNAAKMDQATSRIRRDDSKKHVTAIFLIAQGSVEEGVLKIADRKKAMSEAVFNGVQGGFSEIDDLQELEMLLAPISPHGDR